MDDSDWSDVPTDEDTNQGDDGARLTIDLTAHDIPQGIKRRRLLRNGVRGQRPRKQRIAARDLHSGDIGVSQDEADIFHSRLDSTAKKLGLNRTQVKSVIRRLVESPDLFNHVLKMTGEKCDSNDSSAKVEPRITRKLAKKMIETGEKLNWFLDQMSKSCEKASEESIALLNQEFPDDESDLEYDPLNDPEALAEISDDDSSFTCTPVSMAPVLDTVSPSGSISNPSPQPSSRKPDDAFKKPAESSKAVKCLKFDAGIQSSRFSLLDSGSQSPRLTRSRASLKQVTIEELDTNYVPCDITLDMYDTEVDDYTLFLAKTFGQPLDENEVDTDPDPDFDYQEAEELVDFQDEFVHNRSTKIPQREVDQLMKELFDAYELDQEKESTARRSKLHKRDQAQLEEEDYCGSAEAAGASVSYNVGEEPSDRLQEHVQLIRQQLRQHIQILAQLTILSKGQAELQEMTDACRTMLTEIMLASFKKPYSIFAAENLFLALHAIGEWEDQGYNAQSRTNDDRSCLSPELMYFMATRPAFIYPDLLPQSLRLINGQNKKAYWSQHENNLIALSLESVSRNKNVPSSRLISDTCSYIVKNGIIKNKTLSQVKLRVKNMKSTKRQGDLQANPIAHFMKYGILPKSSKASLIPQDASAPKLLINRLQELPPSWQEALGTPAQSVLKRLPVSAAAKKPESEQASLRKKATNPVASPEARVVEAPRSILDSAIAECGLNDQQYTEPAMMDTDKTESSGCPSKEAMQREQESLEMVMLAREALDQGSFEAFLDVLDRSRGDQIQTYTELHKVCRGQPQLQQRLLDLLAPDQAKALGYRVQCMFLLRQLIKPVFGHLPPHQQAHLASATVSVEELQVLIKEAVSVASKDAHHLAQALCSQPVLNVLLRPEEDADQPGGALCHVSCSCGCHSIAPSHIHCFHCTAVLKP